MARACGQINERCQPSPICRLWQAPERPSSSALSRSAQGELFFRRCSCRILCSEADLDAVSVAPALWPASDKVRGEEIAAFLSSFWLRRVNQQYR
jgi:hypothetical protein